MKDSKNKAVLWEWFEKCFADNTITDKERDFLLKKAESLGIDPCEFDIEIEAEILKRNQEKRSQKKPNLIERIRSSEFQLFGIGTCELTGILFGIPVVFLSYHHWDRGFFRQDLEADPMTGTIIAFVIIGVMFWRGVITFKNKNKIGRLISIVFNDYIIGGVISLFLEAIEFGIFSACVTAFCLTLLLFGMRSIAKMAVFVSITVMCFSAIGEIGDAMGAWGFIYIPSLFISYYLQENINMKELSRDFAILYNKTKDSIDTSAVQAANEMEQIGNLAKNYVGLPSGAKHDDSKVVILESESNDKPEQTIKLLDEE